MLTQPHAADTQPLPTALLRHETGGGSHYDWLLADPNFFNGITRPAPGDDDPWLWTARVALPSARWRDAEIFEVEPIVHHRWRYLTYEGPLSHGRGSVTRVDQGVFGVIEWSAAKIEVHLTMRDVRGTLRLEPGSNGRWLARWLE